MKKDIRANNEDYFQVLCPCCGGKKYQYNKLTGINIICPCCKGSGLDSVHNPKTEFEIIGAWDKENSKEIKG